MERKAAAAETTIMPTSRWVLLFLILLNAAALTASIKTIGSYPAIFVFGDSLSDTGNAALYYSNVPSADTPYGETFPGWPTGRFSDGRLLVDFLAVFLDLPLLNPFLNSSANFEGGVNYAVAGATALNTSYLSTLDIQPTTNLSLEVQLSWHLEFRERVASSGAPLAEVAFLDGLYVIEIGGNDHIYAYLANYTPLFVNFTLIPMIMQKIRSIVEVLIMNGARHFLFVSITPLGCSPCMLVRIDSSKDGDGCLEEYNLASAHHGAYLQTEVATLRAAYPDATFLFLDLYGAYQYIQENKEAFGFVENLRACCGAGDEYPYNFNPRSQCTRDSVSVCSDPSTYMLWDGLHLTDALNSQIFNQTFVTGYYLDTSQSLL